MSKKLDHIAKHIEEPSFPTPSDEVLQIFTFTPITLSRSLLIIQCTAGSRLVFVRATVNSQAKFSIHTKPSEEPPQWCACPDATVPPAGPVLTSLRHPQSALFNFKSFLIVILLFICASTYLRQQRPSMFVEKKPGCAPSWHLSLAVQPSKRPLSLCSLPPFRRLFGLVYKASVIGALLHCPHSLSNSLFFLCVLMPRLSCARPQARG